MVSISKFFFFLIVLSPAAFGSKLSLQHYLEEVKTANPNLEASRLRALALEHRVSPSRTLEDPFIAAGIDEIPFEGGGAELRRYQVSQSIPFPGKLSTRGRVAENRAEAGKLDADTIARQIRVIATQAYFRAVFNLENLKLNKRIQKVLEEISSSAKSRYRTGSDAHHEWLQAKLELSTLKVDFLRLQRTQTTLTALLNELRNRSPATPLELIELNFDVKDHGEVRLDNQPELIARKRMYSAAEEELKLAKLSYAPDFVIQGMAMEPTSKNMSGVSSNWGVMVGVTVPLYFWSKQNELVAAAEKDRAAAALEFKSLENRLRTEVSEASQQYKTAIDVVKLYESDVIPVTEVAVKNARASYTARTLPLRQLLDALKAQRTQELEFLAAKMDVQLSKLRMTELLSSPPLLRLTPARPTLFGSDMTSSMGPANEMGGSATINMGSGMSGPTRTQTPAATESSSGTGGM